jgi:hypothetical protein
LPTDKVISILQSSGINISSEVLVDTINNLAIGVTADEIRVNFSPKSNQSEIDNADEVSDIENLAIDAASSEIKDDL